MYIPWEGESHSISEGTEALFVGHFETYKGSFVSDSRQLIQVSLYIEVTNKCPASSLPGDWMLASCPATLPLRLDVKNCPFFSPGQSIDRSLQKVCIHKQALSYTEGKNLWNKGRLSKILYQCTDKEKTWYHFFPSFLNSLTRLALFKQCKWWNESFAASIRNLWALNHV